MAEPVPAQKAPYKVDVEAGKKYFWCACGRSKNQPFCDGSHKGTGLNPVPYEAEAPGAVFFCGCKSTGRKPLCDGIAEAGARSPACNECDLAFYPPCVHPRLPERRPEIGLAPILLWCPFCHVFQLAIQLREALINMVHIDRKRLRRRGIVVFIECRNSGCECVYRSHLDSPFVDWLPPEPFQARRYVNHRQWTSETIWSSGLVLPWSWHYGPQPYSGPTQ